MTIKKKTRKKLMELVELIIEIIKLIKKGIPEKEAVKEIAQKFNLSFAEVNKIWKKRKKFQFIT